MTVHFDTQCLHSLPTLRLQIVDCVGVGDSNPRRKLAERQAEESLDTVILMLNGNLESAGPVSDHLLQTSPFFRKWFQAQVDPDRAPRKLALHVMINV